MVPLYDSVGFQDHESDPLLDQYKRQKALSWACELEHSDCLANAAASYAAWMAHPDNTRCDKSSLILMVKEINLRLSDIIPERT